LIAQPRDARKDLEELPPEDEYDAPAATEVVGT
jgi:hypothetical protein